MCRYTESLRQNVEFFEDKEVALVYIGKRLKEAQAVEELLTRSGVEYHVEVDMYFGGVIFRRERAGAFFYVEAGVAEQVRGIVAAAGYRVEPEQKA